MSEARLEPGTTVAERYVVEGLIGAGGLAEVYKVRHADLGTVHALKLLTFRRKGYDERLKLEGQIQANLRHPNVVTVTDIVRVDGQYGLLMEYIEGSSLEALLADRGKLEYVEAMSLFAPVLAAVAWAHDAGAVHRDLKPGNVMLARTPMGWVPKVADFGIGKLVDAASGETGGGGAGRTRAGVAMGTPGYMAPEQVRDSAGVDKRADVFALGIIFYEMLAGRLPFVNDDGGTDLTTTLVREAAPLEAPGVPPETVEAIAKAMSKEPDQRFADARALAMGLGLASHPMFADGVTGGNLREISRGVQLTWTGPPRPLGSSPKEESSATLAPPTGASSSFPTTLPPPMPTPTPTLTPSGGRAVLLAVPLAAGILGLALLALLVTGGMVLYEMTRGEDPVVAPVPAPDPVPAAPADPRPTEVVIAPDPSDPAPVAGFAPTPEPAPEPAPSVVPRPGAVPVPAPAPVEPTAPTPEPAPVVVVAPESAPVVVPEPVAPTPSPAPPPAPVPNLSGTWSGKAAGRPFDLLISASGTSLTADAIFVTGSTRRVEKLSGTLDPATGAVMLRTADGRIRFDGSYTGSILGGTYMQEGNRSLPFSVSR